MPKPEPRRPSPSAGKSHPTSCQRTGVISTRELSARGAVPSEERLAAGPVVMVECIENIPCNPCAYACPRQAITIKGELTDTPEVDFSKCNGCTLCLSKCPGLAIFVVHKHFSKTEAAVTIPYELLPRPETGARVTGLDRAGRAVCKARVLKVLDTKAMNRCAVITVAVPKRYWNTVRSIKVAATNS